MVLSPVSWTSLIKALPILTLLAPSERSNRQRGGRHKLLTDWARQGALQLCRWLPGRRIIFVGDSSFAVHELAHAITIRLAESLPSSSPDRPPNGRRRLCWLRGAARRSRVVE